MPRSGLATRAALTLVAALLLPSALLQIDDASAATVAGAPKDTWVTTGAMAAARAFATASLLRTGNVLVAGGQAADGQILASAELFNPLTGEWSTTASMPHRRRDAMAVVLRNGDVLMMGGTGVGGDGAHLRAAELFNPSTSTWTATGSMSTPRDGASAVLLRSGDVLVAGGRDDGGVLDSAEIYTPSTGRWSATGSMLRARFGQSMVVLRSGRVLAFGGANSLGVPLATSTTYDPATGRWSPAASMHVARLGATAEVLSNGEVLVAGGEMSAGAGILSSSELYDPSTGRWSLTGSMRSPRAFGLSAQLPGGSVLVAGGINSAGAVASAELYEPAQAAWVSTHGMHASRADASSVLLASGAFLAIGGASTGSTLSSSEEYGPSPGSLSRLALTPVQTDVAPGAGQVYGVEGFTASHFDLGPMSATSILSISPNGTCNQHSHTCRATAPGVHTVTATRGGVVGTAILDVIPTSCATQSPCLYDAAYAASGVQLSFVPPMVRAGASITGYALEVSTDGGVTLVNGASSGLACWSDSVFSTACLDGEGAAAAVADPYLDAYAADYCPQAAPCYYRMSAELNDGTSLSPYSSWVQVGPALTAPTLVGAAYVDGGTSLSFTPPSLPAGLAVTSYDFEVSTDGGATLVDGASLGLACWSDSVFSTACLDDPGTAAALADPYLDTFAADYCPQTAPCSYRIRAETTDEEWQTAWSGWVQVGPPLAAPTLTSAAYVDSGVSLTFTPPSLSAGLTITSYDLEVSTDGGTTLVDGTGAGEPCWSDSVFSTACLDGGGSAGAVADPYLDAFASSYCPQTASCSYRIRAETGDQEWQTPWSGWVQVGPGLTGPSLDSADYVDGGVSLSFTPPDLSAGLTITSYDLEVSTDGGTTLVDGAGLGLACWSDSVFSTACLDDPGSAAAVADPYLDTFAADYCPQTAPCSYRIRAEAGGGEWLTPWSAWVVVGDALGAPSLDSADYVDGGVSLSFTAPTPAAGLTITSYDLEVSTDGGTTLVDGASLGLACWSDAVFSTACLDGGGTPGAVADPFVDTFAADYCSSDDACAYRIRAETGDQEWQSPWSGWTLVS